MGKSEESFARTALKWILRFIKFNAVGFVVFLVGTAIFALTFHHLGIWAWFIASASGGILQFILISYLNTTKLGNIFDSTQTKKEKDQKNS
jgi:uncharacterized membrane protein